MRSPRGFGLWQEALSGEGHDGAGSVRLLVTGDSACIEGEEKPYRLNKRQSSGLKSFLGRYNRRQGSHGGSKQLELHLDQYPNNSSSN